MARLSRADVLVRVGMDFDLWADALIAAARNKKVAVGGPGYVDASQRIKRLEVPTEKITGASGDIHALGNPHYYYDPGCAKVIAHNILLGLRRVSPGDAGVFDANYRSSSRRLMPPCPVAAADGGLQGASRWSPTTKTGATS